MSKKLYEWDDIEAFDLWHNPLCVELGYPITPINQATGLPDENAQKIVSYTTPYPLEGKIVAFVEDQYSAGLTVTDLQFPEPPYPQE